MRFRRPLIVLTSLVALLGTSANAHATVTYTPTPIPDVNVVVGPAATSGTVSYAVPVAVSDLGAIMSTNCIPASGTAFAIGDTTVTCSSFGMTMGGCFPSPMGGCTPMPGLMDNGSTSFVVHVVRDITAPTLAATANQTLAATSAAGAVATFAVPSATDSSGVDAASRSCAPASGSTFPVGVTTVTCTAADTFGTAGTSTFTVTVTPLEIVPTPTTPTPTAPTPTTPTPADPAPVATGSGDTIFGSELADMIRALGGDDVIRGLFGDDVLYGDAGADQLFGNDGADSLFGGNGNDRLAGGNGADKLNGGLGIDTLLGGPGNDLVYARGNRRDIVDCGTGNDIASVDFLDIVRNCEKVFRR